MNGMLLIDKSAQMTSFEVIAKLRRISGQKRIGHTGTLDPQATGLLIVLMGTATKLVPFLDYQEKYYDAVIQFGLASDTYDLEGKIIEYPDERIPTISEINEIIPTFLGQQTQYPPIYSAIKVNGKKLYEYARKDQEVTIKPRTVEIMKIEVIDYADRKLKLKIACGKGTYIRSLAHDLGQKLGVHSLLASLRRTRIGNYKVEDAYKLENLPPLLAGIRLFTPYEILSDQTVIDYPDRTKILNGMKIKLDCTEKNIFVSNQKEIIAAYTLKEDGYYHCVRGLR